MDTSKMKSILSSSTSINGQPFVNFGVIGGERKFSSHSRNDTSISAHSELLADSEPLESDGTPFSSPCGPISRPYGQSDGVKGLAKRITSREFFSYSPDPISATGNDVDSTLQGILRQMSRAVCPQTQIC